MVSAVFLGILEQTQISSPRPLLSRPSLQVRIRRLFLSVAVFRVRERVHAKRAARWNREESYRSPLVHFSYFFFDAATAAHASLLQLLLGIIARRGGVAVSERSRRSSERSLRRNS